jgi:hypothetical protein
VVGSFVFALSLAHMAKMAGRGPYPVNGDEGYVAGSAWNMVLSRDPNPHLFNYGSLPIYLTALCQIVGGTLAKWRGEIGQFREVYSVWFPYYTNLSVSYLPRLLFAAFGSASLLLIASLAYRVARRWEALVAPLILAQSRLFEFHSWAYVNVDILVALFLAAYALFTPFAALGVVALSRGASSVAQRVLGVSQATGSRRAAQLSRAGSLVAIALLALATPLVSNTRALFTSDH